MSGGKYSTRPAGANALMRAGVLTAIPRRPGAFSMFWTGIDQSQRDCILATLGCEERGDQFEKLFNPNGVAALASREMHANANGVEFLFIGATGVLQPRWGWRALPGHTQGSSFLATLG